MLATFLACAAPDPAPAPDDTAPDDTSSADSGRIDSGSADTGPAEFAVPEHPYLLAFHTCPTDEEVCGDPSNHRVSLAGSHDGATWEVLEWAESFPGSVPDVLVRDGILYLYSLPELRRYDLSTFEVLPGRSLSFVSEEDVFHADPSVTLDADGRIVMFFLEGAEGVDPAGCEETPCTKRILSATEVDGSLGSVFTVDDGARLEVVIEEDGPSRLSDPDISFGPDGHVLLVSRGQSVRVYVSDTLRGTYTALGKDNLTPGTGGVPAADHIGDEYWLYASVDQSGGTSDIQWAALPDISQILPADTLSPITLVPDPGDNVLSASPGFWAVE